jgi:large subunit ribosomal protein L22
MQAVATQKYARISAQKARLVGDQIRGQHVERALNELQFSTKKAAQLFKKLLESAIANAENNNNITSDVLTVEKAVIEEGPAFRRFRPVARGMAHPFRKRTSHIRIVLTDEVTTTASN